MDVYDAVAPAVGAVLFNPSLVRNVLDHIEPNGDRQATSRSFRTCCQGTRNAWDQQLSLLDVRDRPGTDQTEVVDIVRRFLTRGGRPITLRIGYHDGGNSEALAKEVLQAFLDVAAVQPDSSMTTAHLKLNAGSLTPDVGRTAAAALPCLSQLSLISNRSKGAWDAALQGLEALLQGSGGQDGSAPVAPQLRELCIHGMGEAGPLPPQLVASLATCTSLHRIFMDWDSAHAGFLRQLGSLAQLQRLQVGTMPMPLMSELRPLTNLTKLEFYRPRGVASAAQLACLPALRNLDLDCGLLDARGLETLTGLTSLAVGVLLGPEHIAALPADQDGFELGISLPENGAGLLSGALPPLGLPLPTYQLPPRLVQLRFCIAAQFVEVLAAVQPPPSLERILLLDGNGGGDFLQLPLLQGRHAVTDAAAAGGEGEDGEQPAGPSLLPAAAQAVQSFARQLGSRLRDCSDVRVVFVAPPPGDGWLGDDTPVLLPPPPGWNLPPGLWARGVQEAPGSHGAWVSGLAGMPGLRGLWLQGLALTTADLRTIGIAFTGIQALSLLGVNLRCCPYASLPALGPLLPRLRQLRLAGDPLLAPRDDAHSSTSTTLYGAVAAVLATLRNSGGADVPRTSSASAVSSSSSSSTDGVGFRGVVELVCGCDMPGGYSEDLTVIALAMAMAEGVNDALNVMENAGMGEEVAEVNVRVAWVATLDPFDTDSALVQMNTYGWVPQWED